MVPVPEDQLPVVLPLDAEFTPTGQIAAGHARGVPATRPVRAAAAPARRETDTMDTFVDSSWYWFRYTSPHDETAPFDPEAAARWTPVDLYCGGIEHAILHLLYARFFTKVLRDLGLIEHGEPFLRLRNQGMILAEEGTKMSKSRGTQVAPDELVAAARRRRAAAAPDVPRSLGAGRSVERARHHRHGALHPPRVRSGHGDRRRARSTSPRRSRRPRALRSPARQDRSSG